MILILTLANKPALLLEALECVRRQTRGDYRHIVHLDRDDQRGLYPLTRFFNTHMAAARTGDYITWLSDDDYWHPDHLAVLAGYMDAHPQCAACYGWSEEVTYDPATGETRHMRHLPADRIYDATNLPLCKVDGGQVLIAERLLCLLDRPWMTESLRDCNISDGVWLNRIASVVPIEPVRTEGPIMQHRVTPQSSHWALVNGSAQFVHPETVRRLQG